ncbi:MAG: hypothetical protein ABF307_07235, partial [Candidatus Nanopelagicales bacterium]
AIERWAADSVLCSTPNPGKRARYLVGKAIDLLVPRLGGLPSAGVLWMQPESKSVIDLNLFPNSSQPQVQGCDARLI